MLEERELIAAILSVLVLFFFFQTRGKFKSTSYSGLLLTSLALFSASLIFSVLEVFFWEDVNNFFQHMLALMSMVVFAIWSWLIFVRGGGVST